MAIIKQLRMIEIHPSGWPFLAGIATGSLIVDTILGIPYIFFVGGTLFTIYVFRVQKPTIPIEQKMIVAPLSGKITQISEIDSQYKSFFLKQPVKKIAIRCGLYFPASLHAPTSMRIIEKQQIKEASSRFVILKASILEPKKNDISGEIIMMFSSSIPYLYPECNVEVEDTLSKGQNFGFLPFGGNLNLLIPTDFSPLKIENQTTISGETILAMSR